MTNKELIKNTFDAVHLSETAKQKILNMNNTAKAAEKNLPTGCREQHSSQKPPEKKNAGKAPGSAGHNAGAGIRFKRRSLWSCQHLQHALGRRFGRK